MFNQYLIIFSPCWVSVRLLAFHVIVLYVLDRTIKARIVVSQKQHLFRYRYCSKSGQI
jgi:hypothetical protein